MLGNEAIARGAIEAGVSVATTYPGTPSSEIGEALSRVARSLDLYFEYSTNEKVALETAAGASIAGLRAFTFMKHVGLNVASDPFVTLATTGVRGGMVVLTADDPSAHSSQNEQDNRYYSLLANVPMLEPSDPAEAKEMVRLAFDISEELELPILVRTTTRVNHARAPVSFGPLRHRNVVDGFERDPFRFVTVPLVARRRHPWLLEQMKKAREMSETSKLNRIEGDGDVGIITSGVAYTYAVEASEALGLEARILKLGFTHPFPGSMVRKFLSSVERCVIVEELEPYLELHTRAEAQREGIGIPILGKDDGHFPRALEFDVDVVLRGFASAIGAETVDRDLDVTLKAPSRPPTLCPGCPHRASFYAAKVASGGRAVYSMDIGCYTLGLLPPLQIADIEICMGSSLGTACGFSKALDTKIIAFIGDSTFFHAGIPALINAVHNKHDFVLAILDNRTTAMTGHQPHPGNPKDGMGGSAPALDLASVVRGLGIEFVRVVNPYHVKETIKVFREALAHEGIAVVICRMACALLIDAQKRSSPEGIVPYRINQEMCKRCMVCVERFGCVALYVHDGNVYINPQLCDGCGVCAQICPYNAMEVMK